ncbi:MAG: PIN domain-containing protein [Gemmatimonadetes bacterium]|nr:PIN domain-containing protein [Gemmatimonadota bacterium]
MTRYVLDTNVFINADRDARWADELDRFSTEHLPHIHLSAVVVQEMLAGAVSPDRERAVRENYVEPFERRGRLITPTYNAWKRAGQIMSRLVNRKLMSPGAFARSFVNDCLLAASCRERGATLITLNVRDFELIRKIEPITVVPPWPE